MEYEVKDGPIPAKFEELITSFDELPENVRMSLLAQSNGLIVGQKEFVSFLKAYLFGDTKGLIVRDSFVYDYVDYNMAFLVVAAATVKRYVKFSNGKYALVIEKAKEEVKEKKKSWWRSGKDA